MAVHEQGAGDPVVFLHGNPTSSYLWRNVVPHVAGSHRCIVPDLIGQGDSDKLDDSGPGSYSFVEHRRYLDGLLDQLDLGDSVTFVIHDWGSALGFDWANRHRDRVAGIAYMEAIVMPVTWAQWPEAARGIFQSLRSDKGEDMVLQRNLFVEAILPASILRPLAQPDRGHRGGKPLHSGGQPGRDRAGDRRLAGRSLINSVLGAPGSGRPAWPRRGARRRRAGSVPGRRCCRCRRQCCR